MDLVWVLKLDKQIDKSAEFQMSHLAKITSDLTFSFVKGSITRFIQPPPSPRCEGDFRESRWILGVSGGIPW